MPRARFAKAVKPGRATSPSARRSAKPCGSTSRRADTSDDDLAGRGPGSPSFDHVALLLGATHLLIGATSLVRHPELALLASLANPDHPAARCCSPSTSSRRCRLQWRDQLELAPHIVTRAMCGYLARRRPAVDRASALAMHASTRTPLPARSSRRRSAPGIAMAAMVVHQLAAAGGRQRLRRRRRRGVLLASRRWSRSGSPACLILLVAYSVAGARTMIAAGRRRLNLDREARKALNFVDEFENSGRGWFWETNPEGTLSYVSQQLADDFQCEPAELLGRQFTDLLSVDTGGDRCDRGAQDARLPPVGALPLLRRGRPRGQRPGRPLVAVGQPDLRRARPLPRLPRHRHRPDRAAPLGAGNHAPRALRFADRPAQPGDDAPDARRSAAQRRRAARRAAACS